MKRTLLTLALAAAPLLALAQPQAPQSLKAEVNGMVCSFCAQGIEKRMKTLSATQSVWVDLKNKTVAVEMKPGQRIDVNVSSAGNASELRSASDIYKPGLVFTIGIAVP